MLLLLKTRQPFYLDTEAKESPDHARSAVAHAYPQPAGADYAVASLSADKLKYFKSQQVNACNMETAMHALL
jgi:hypothetical protein